MELRAEEIGVEMPELAEGRIEECDSVRREVPL
jgi:hypothetical protein